MNRIKIISIATLACCFFTITFCRQSNAGIDLPAAGLLSPADLRCEYMVNPLGVDVDKPRLSWVCQSGLRGQKQTAYRLLVASTPEKLKKNIGDLWDSGFVKSDKSIHVTYKGKSLQSDRQ